MVRSSTIPKELGRIGYLLSDKTDTFTRNEMLHYMLQAVYKHGTGRLIINTLSILYPDNACPSVCLSVRHGCGRCYGTRSYCHVASRYNVGQSANSEWWVASWLQPWSLSQQCDTTKGLVPNNGPGIPVALVMQGIIP